MTHPADDPRSRGARVSSRRAHAPGGLETIDDRVDVVTRGFLASTVACARCHDHKFDPITTKDYYSLYSIFENTERAGGKAGHRQAGGRGRAIRRS